MRAIRKSGSEILIKVQLWQHTYPYAASGQCKMMQRTCNMTEILDQGYSFQSTQRELSNEYQ